MRLVTVLFALVVLFPILALAEEDALEPKAYALGDTVKDFKGKDPNGITASLLDVTITAERADTAALDAARAYAKGGEVTKKTSLAALKGLLDDDGEIDDFEKSEMIGMAGRRFGLVATDDRVDEVETVGDVAAWIHSAKDSPIAVVLWSSGCSTCVNFYNEKVNEIVGEENVRLVVVASEQYETTALVIERLDAFPFYWKVVMDQTQVIKDQFVLGATRSPHVFLLDKERVLRYRGSVDSDPTIPNGDDELTEWTRDAIRAVKGGKKVATEETEPKGCPMRPVKR